MKFFPIKKFKKFAIVLISIYLLFVIIYFSLLSYVNQKLQDKQSPNIYQSCNKVWSNRGLVTEGDLAKPSSGNSIKTLSLAFASGAKGAEVDVYFDPIMAKYIVSHDRPYNLKNGSLLTLDELFSAVGSNVYIWLDFKKMGHLSDVDADTAVERLHFISNKYGNKDKIYLESEGPKNLGKFRDAGYQTIFDTQPLTEDYWVSEFVINIYKMAYFFGDFSVMAMNYGSIENPIYGVKAQQSLKNVPLFIYHVPEKTNHIEYLSSIKNVRVILNENHSLNNYAISSCE